MNNDEPKGISWKSLQVCQMYCRDCKSNKFKIFMEIEGNRTYFRAICTTCNFKNELIFGSTKLEEKK